MSGLGEGASFLGDGDFGLGCCGEVWGCWVVDGEWKGWFASFSRWFEWVEVGRMNLFFLGHGPCRMIYVSMVDIQLMMYTMSMAGFGFLLLRCMFKLGLLSHPPRVFLRTDLHQI
jgi:hypothetical protein